MWAPKDRVRPSHPTDQQTLSQGKDITKNMRTPDAGPQQWLLRSEVGVVVTHQQRRELPAVAGSGGGKEKQSMPSWGQRWAGGIINLPPCHPHLYLHNSSQAMEEEGWIQSLELLTALVNAPSSRKEWGWGGRGIENGAGRHGSGAPGLPPSSSSFTPPFPETTS